MREFFLKIVHFLKTRVVAYLYVCMLYSLFNGRIFSQIKKISQQVPERQESATVPKPMEHVY